MDDDFILYIIVLVAVIIFSALIAFSFESTGNNLGSGSGTKAGNSTTALSQLTITASGSVSNASTQSLLYVSINGTGPTTQAATQNLSSTLNRFNSTIAPFINGNLSKITTSNYNTYKVFNSTIFQAQESLMVSLPNIANTSAAIGAVSNIPNVYISEAAPELSNAQIKGMRIQALQLALANATSQADALIGPNDTIYATNISVNNYVVYPFAYATAQASGPGTSPAITPKFYGGTNQVTESVSVVFSWGKKQ